MARETIPLPAICQTAFAQLRAQCERAFAELGEQAVLSVGRDPKTERWSVDADPITGALGISISRDIPESIETPAP